MTAKLYLFQRMLIININYHKLFQNGEKSYDHLIDEEKAHDKI